MKQRGSSVTLVSRRETLANGPAFDAVEAIGRDDEAAGGDASDRAGGGIGVAGLIENGGGGVGVPGLEEGVVFADADEGVGLDAAGFEGAVGVARTVAGEVDARIFG